MNRLSKGNTIQNNTEVKAPGKILWIGGYSVLERPNISFVSAVDAYVTAKLKTNSGVDIELDVPQLNMSAKGKIDHATGKIIGDYQKELLLLKTAAEVALRYVVGLGLNVSGFGITTKNDAPFAYSLSTGKVVKSGLGSSAAVTVATVGAVLKAFDADPAENDALHKLAQTAHSIATGKVGSGFDIAASSFGSIFYTRYSPEILKVLPAEYSNKQLVDLVRKPWDYRIEKFSLPNKFRLLFANFGEAMITTAAVGSVSDFKKRNPDEYNKLIKQINDENVRAVDALKKIGACDKDAIMPFKDAFDKGRLLTKKLGELSNMEVEPEDCTKLIEESKAKGAFVAKLPGAGGMDAIAALALDTKSYDTLKAYWNKRKDLSMLPIKTVDIGVI